MYNIAIMFYKLPVKKFYRVITGEEAKATNVTIEEA